MGSFRCVSDGMIRRRTLPFLILTLAAGSVGAVQFHVPVHLPPHRLEAARTSGPSAWFGGGYGYAAGPGMSLSGPGGFWELAGTVSDELAVSVHGGGLLLTGEMDPFGAGRRRTTGGAALLEVDMIWAPAGRGSYHLYTGLQGHLTVLDVRDPLPIMLGGSSTRVEPGTAVSPVLGVPFGALLPIRLGGGWSAQWQADATAFPAGVTYFTYGPGGPSAYEGTRRVDFTAAAGTGVRLSYEPWRLSLEAMVRHSLGFGNNEPVTQSSLMLVIGAL